MEVEHIEYSDGTNDRWLWRTFRTNI